MALELTDITIDVRFTEGRTNAEIHIFRSLEMGTIGPIHCDNSTIF